MPRRRSFAVAIKSRILNRRSGSSGNGGAWKLAKRRLFASSELEIEAVSAVTRFLPVYWHRLHRHSVARADSQRALNWVGKQQALRRGVCGGRQLSELVAGGENRTARQCGRSRGEGALGPCPIKNDQLLERSVGSRQPEPYDGLARFCRFNYSAGCASRGTISRGVDRLRCGSGNCVHFFLHYFNWLVKSAFIDRAVRVDCSK